MGYSNLADSMPSRCETWLADRMASVQAAIFCRIASSSPARSSSKSNCSNPLGVSRRPCKLVRSAKTCVTRKPVPKRPVVSSDSKSLLEPPDSNAVKSLDAKGTPSCSNATVDCSQLREIATDELPSRGPKSSAFWSNSNGQRSPADGTLRRASATFARIRLASLRLCCSFRVSSNSLNAASLNGLPPHQFSRPSCSPVDCPQPGLFHLLVLGRRPLSREMRHHPAGLVMTPILSVSVSGNRLGIL